MNPETENTAARRSPFPQRWYRRSFPPTGASDDERRAWIVTNVIEDEAQGIRGRAAAHRDQASRRVRLLELRRRGWW